MSDFPRVDDRERRLIDAVVSLAKSFREEHDRLARRLGELEREVEALAIRLSQQERSAPQAPGPAGPSRDPSRAR